MKVVLVAAFLLLTIPVSIADTCGGNCPSNDCSSCPCGYSQNNLSIQDWCSKYNGWDQNCCHCIVTNESGGNSNAVNDDGGGYFDVGLWQIDTANWGDCNGGNAPCDPEANLNCAIQLYKEANNSWDWWATAAGCGCTN